MDKVRAQFEQSETAKKYLSSHIHFDDIRNGYYTDLESQTDADALNAAWSAWQELYQRIDATLVIVGKMARCPNKVAMFAYDLDQALNGESIKSKGNICVICD